MSNSLVQFRAEDSVKVRAAQICEQLGIDLPTYLRICVSRLVRENGIPFSMKLDGAEESKAVLAMRQASRIAREQGIADMSLDEINAEIAAAREQELG
ncbi:MAG: type II toxin-antitoxin system RelB/DinJ family antitoxin [Clostridia bacterium]|nr:type II toxin-antitoxin system RelB/DinJ family antitoxin [Clostridia bacterium]